MRTPTALLALALGLAACERNVPPSTDPPARTAAVAEPRVGLAAAAHKFLAIETLGPTEAGAPRAYFGRTAFRPKAVSAVTAPLAGRIATVAVEPGRRVRSGSTLFVVESADAAGIRSLVEQARIKLRVAEEVLARQTEMARRGVGLEIERFDAEMKLREARTELARSERGTALLGAGDGAVVNVRAPVDGVVVSVKAAPGATVQPGGDALVEIGNPAGLWVVAEVPEGEVGQALKAATVEVTVSALNLAVRGRVVGAAPRSDAETRRTPVYVELERTAPELRAGLLVRVAMTPKAAPVELWLPVTAVLLKEGGKRVVYLEGEDGRFTPREIEVGDERGGRVRVLKGLEPGARVVMRGALLVDREAEQLL